MFAPVVRLDQGQTQPFQANANNSGVVPEQPVQGTELEGLQPAKAQPFNFGVARFDRSFEPGAGSVGQDINGKSLGEIAREMRQHPNGTNARVYTNTDLNNLGGGMTGAASTAAQDNWSGNNGVINPEGQPAQPAMAAPQNNEPTPQGQRSPFAPPITQSTPEPNTAPEPEIRPFARRGEPAGGEPVQMAQANPGNSPLSAQAAPSDSGRSRQSAKPTSDNELPHSASRLPLLGVLGLFTVTMGIFVRYQRQKTK